MPRTKATAAADQRYYEAHKEAILAKKKVAGKNYRDHKLANESPEARAARLEHQKTIRQNLAERKNLYKLTPAEVESKLLPPFPNPCYCLTPKAFEKFLASARQEAAKKAESPVDGGEAHSVVPVAP
jgi:hypothetical protein